MLLEERQSLKRFMTPLTEDSNRSGSTVHPGFLVVVALAVLSVACISEPEPAAEYLVPTGDSSVVGDGSVVDGGEPVLDLPLFHQLMPAGASLSFELAEPAFLEPAGFLVPPEGTADASGQAGFQPGSVAPDLYPVDITVLSRLPDEPAISVPMPDPVLSVLPDPLPPVTVPSLPAPKIPQAAAVTPTVPVPAPAVTASKTVPSEKESTSSSVEVAEPETLPADRPSPVLPVPPSSSARSVDAAPRAIPETRVEVPRGQRFELRLRGSGWTFLGDEDGKDGVRYETRRFEDNHAVFVMNPSLTGEYLLRFQRQDPLELRTEASLVRLLVNPSPANGFQGAGPSPLSTFVVASAGSPASVAAPSNIPGMASPSAFPATETAAAVGAALGGSSVSNSLLPAGTATLPDALSAAASQAATPAAATSSSVVPAATQPAATQPVSTPSTQPATQPAGQAAGQSVSQVATQPVGQASSPPAASTLTDPVALIKLARDELSAKRVNAAMEALDRYKSLYPYVGDEVFYLYALAYEQDTPLRDIKKAYENYRRVRDEFPRSQFWRQSADKTAYLERHYPGLR